MNKVVTRAIGISHHYQAMLHSIIGLTDFKNRSTCLGHEDYGPTSTRGFSTVCRRTGTRSYEIFYVKTSFSRSRGNGNFSKSFVVEDDQQPKRRSSGGYHRDKDHKHDQSPKPSDLTSDRLALGLSASGPLSLEQVKNAYRACALKWHPDHHADSSKAIAEEKFKTLNASYQSLCDKMTLNQQEVCEAH